jgi:hypothetical protein
LWCGCTSSSVGTICLYSASAVEVEDEPEAEGEMWSESECDPEVGIEFQPADMEFVDIAAAFAEGGIVVGVDGRIGCGGFLSWYY